MSMTLTLRTKTIPVIIVKTVKMKRDNCQYWQKSSYTANKELRGLCVNCNNLLDTCVAGLGFCEGSDFVDCALTQLWPCPSAGHISFVCRVSNSQGPDGVLWHQQDVGPAANQRPALTVVTNQRPGPGTGWGDLTWGNPGCAMVTRSGDCEHSNTTLSLLSLEIITGKC